MATRILAIAFFWASGLAVAADLPAPAVPPPPSIAAKSYVLMEADTGNILAEQNSGEPLHPASLTKIMTAYVAAGELESGRIAPDDQVLVSVKAWRTPGSRMFIQEGTDVAVADLLRGIIVQSGNDASVALAEHIAGSEEAFVDMMNRQADTLGMTATQFKNSAGTPGRGSPHLCRRSCESDPRLYPQVSGELCDLLGALIQVQRHRAAQSQSPAVARPHG